VPPPKPVYVMELSILFTLIIFLPGILFAAFGLGWLLGWQPSERVVVRATVGGVAAITCAAFWLPLHMWWRGQTQFQVSLGDWFRAQEYHFPLTLMADRLSLTLIALSCLLIGVVASFSKRYLHRDPGFLRFFLLLQLFAFGILLLFAAGSFDLLIGGWELVGLTSVLLIGFFQHRDDPVRNALRVFLAYRIADVGLLTGVALLHHFAGTAAYEQLFTANAKGLSGGGASLIGLLFLFAAMGKAAQVPFSGWLPRAMEGPTPSSAIFYGALSVHAGAYLLLRAYPLFADSWLVCGAIIAIGLATAMHGTMVGRACSDVKTALAYAAMTQVGLIFVEIGLGLRTLALLHIGGHAAVRTLQFLRAPSMLHDHHRLHAAAGGHLGETGAHIEQILPALLRQWLYRWAIERGHHDTVLERFVLSPVIALARFFQQMETRWAALVIGPVNQKQPSLAAKAGLFATQNPTIKMERADA
jgi:NADH-quinone oxidoreductase subunit L